MRWFDTRHVVLDCGRCGSTVAYAGHRGLPARLDLRELGGPPLAPERAGRVLQRLDAGGLTLDPGRAAALREWLDRNAVELVYRLTCPQDGAVWVAVPDITAAIRAAAPGITAVTIPTR